MAEENQTPQNEVDLDTDGVNEETIDVNQKQAEPDPTHLPKENVDLGYTDISKPAEEKETKVEEKTVEEKVEKPEQKPETDNLTKKTSDYQKRINELVFKQKEAERREQAALKYAKGLKKKFSDLEKTSEETSNNYLKEYDARVDSETDKQKKMLKEAIDAQDSDRIADANAAIAKLAVEKEKVNVSLTAKKAKEEAAKQNKAEESTDPETTPPPVSEKATDWATRNPWFGTDEVMTGAAMSIHQQLITQGVVSDTDEYYNNINKRMKEYFPQKFAQDTTEEKKTQASRPVQNVASVSRRQGGRKSVKLTKSQVVIAKKLGVPLEEYAKYVKEAE